MEKINKKNIEIEKLIKIEEVLRFFIADDSKKFACYMDILKILGDWEK